MLASAEAEAQAPGRQPPSTSLPRSVGRRIDLDPGSDGSTIKGLNIVDFHESANAAGVAIHSLYDTVAATWIGVDASVPFAPFYAGNVDGIRIEDGGGSARIGLPTTGGRNVISGNDGDAIDINGGGFNTVENTYIGTDFNGTLIVDQNVGFNLYNLGNGVTIENGSQFNAIGALPTPGSASDDSLNVIAGNFADGISIGGNSSGHRHQFVHRYRWYGYG